MRSVYRLPATTILLGMLSFAVVGQSIATPGTSPSSAAVVVTISATPERVRITAPNTVVQLRLEIYDELGRKVFDTEQHGGSVLDWYLQDRTEAKVPEGRYAGVVTIKNLSGRFSQKLASIEVTAQGPVVRRNEETQLNAPQLQVVGVIEEDPNLTIVEAGETAAVTLTTHNGEEGQLIRTRGAFTFRFGDFFSGQDAEQMRLTEAGDLGIGTTNPQARLDVAGNIRASGFVLASKGIQFPDGSVQLTGLSGRIASDGNLVPNVAGTGTTNQITKWTDNVGTLGDSVITEVNGRVGIGITNPTYRLVVGPDIGPGLTTSDLTISRGPGQSVSIFAGASGANGMNFGWDQANLRAFVNAPVQSPIVFTHGGVSARMTINTNGNIGIGTTAPSTKLDVAGNINTTTQYDIGANRILSVPGTGNTFVGVLAGADNASGINNSFFGFNAGRVNNTANFNSFFGVNSGDSTTSGASNSFFGSNSGQANSVGQQNAFFGSSAGFGNTGGNENTFLGFTAGNVNITGNKNTIVGAFADVGSSNLTNATAIGHRAFATENNSLVLGSINGVNGATADTKVGIGTTIPTTKLDVHNGEISSTGTNGGVFAANNPNNQSARVLLSWFNDGTHDWPRIRYGGSGEGATNGFLVQGPGDSTKVTLLNNGDVGIGAGPNFKVTVLNNGNVGVGTTAPLTRLHVSGDVNNNPPSADLQHVAWIENTDLGSDYNVLALKVGDAASPGTAHNFITFLKGNNASVGAIEGNGSGGVQLSGAGADYAEWLLRIHDGERIEAGHIVGLFNGRITKNTSGASAVMAISTGPIVLGNDPGDAVRAKYEKVAFLGQVMIRVRGTVKAGDFIIASGLDDGTGIAVSPERITSEQFAQVVGEAWESSSDPGVKPVRTAVGLLRRDPSVMRLVQFNRQQAEQIATLRAQLTAIELKIKKELDAIKVLARYKQRASGRHLRMSNGKTAKRRPRPNHLRTS